VAPEIVARDDLAGSLEEMREHACGLRLQSDRRAFTRQAAGRRVELEEAEPDA
jgi:hypothetical protein